MPLEARAEKQETRLYSLRYEICMFHEFTLQHSSLGVRHSTLPACGRRARTLPARRGGDSYLVPGTLYLVLSTYFRINNLSMCSPTTSAQSPILRICFEPCSTSKRHIVYLTSFIHSFISGIGGSS